jgi:hypothetical protein
MKMKPKRGQFSRSQVVVLVSVWALNTIVFAFLTYVFPREIARLAELGLAEGSGVIFLFFPAMVITIAMITHSLRQ